MSIRDREHTPHHVNMGNNGTKFKCTGKSWRCRECKIWMAIERKELHECGQTHCKTCDTYYHCDQHRCFITFLEKKESKISTEFCAYDFESIIDPETGLHTVNYVVAKKLYDNEFRETFFHSSRIRVLVLETKTQYFHCTQRQSMRLVVASQLLSKKDRRTTQIDCSRRQHNNATCYEHKHFH